MHLDRKVHLLLHKSKTGKKYSFQSFKGKLSKPLNYLFLKFKSTLTNKRNSYIHICIYFDQTLEQVAREAVRSPSMEILKVCMGKALSNLT